MGVLLFTNYLHSGGRMILNFKDANMFIVLLTPDRQRYMNQVADLSFELWSQKDLICC